MRLESPEQLERTIAEAADESAARTEAMAELAWHLWVTDLPRAERLSRDALEIAERRGYGLARALAKRNVGLLFYKGVNLEASMNHLNDALRWFEENAHKRGEGDVRLGLSFLFWQLGEFRKGLDQGLKALAAYEEAGDPNGQGWALSALGGFYHDWNDLRQSREYYERAITFFEQTGNRVGIGRSLNGVGNVLSLMGEHDGALEYQEKSLAVNRSAGNEFAAAKTLNDIGLIFQRREDYDEALDYHRKALEIREAHSYAPGTVTCLLDIGNVHIARREYEDARNALNKALVLAEQIHSKPKMCRAHELLSNLYRDLMQFDTALVHFENFHRIREEVYHEDTETKLKNIRTAYQFEAAEREAEIYRLKNVELKDTLSKLRNAQAQLMQTGKMAALGNLVAGLTHEVTQPIGAVKSATDANERAIRKFADRTTRDADTRDDDSLEKLVEVLRFNNGITAKGAARIEKILKSLQTFSRLDEADFQKVDIHEGLESALTLIGPGIAEGVRIERDYGEVPACYVYPGELNQVFMNLLLNATAAVTGDGVIRIRTRSGDGTVQVMISDNGNGIPEDKQHSLFEPGFTTRNSRVRMRTGLYTSYNIIQKHHGDITVDSKPGRGTTFTVTFPDHLERLLRS